jgi:two-component system sensor histidine kinase DesK
MVPETHIANGSLRRWPAWLRPAPDSHLAEAMRRGKSPGSEFIHLLWSVWVFITPAFGMGYDRTWLLLTLSSFPLFLWLYARTFAAPCRQAHWYPLAMVVLSMALLRWYPSGLSYFVFGCVLFAPRGHARGGLPGYLVLVLLFGAAIVAEALWIGYPWQSVVWLPPMTLVIALIVGIEQRERANEAALRLSHEEVRRLAATAERERIGRDLHDLLGHTLSLITLKLELSRKLIDRDAAAARTEIAEAEKVARHALAEVRAAVTGFRAADLAAELAAARLLLESSAVALDYDAPPALSPEIERPLALVLREAATNIARHARATHAEVRFVRDEAQLRMRIVDDGRGASSAEGNGVVGMRERVRALGGSFEFASSKAGTAVEVAVPLPVTATEADA